MDYKDISIGGELKHYGVKGMKWGVRRYQNEDGTLTEAGKKRYDRDVRENKAKKKDNRIVIDGPDPKRWVDEDLDRVKKTADSTHDVVKKARSLESKTRPKAVKQKLDLSSMSDQELREKINRANLEKQYNELFAPEVEPQISLGRKVAASVLEYGDEILTIGTSAVALGIALSKVRR